MILEAEDLASLTKVSEIPTDMILDTNLKIFQLVDDHVSYIEQRISMIKGLFLKNVKFLFSINFSKLFMKKAIHSICRMGIKNVCVGGANPPHLLKAKI